MFKMLKNYEKVESNELLIQPSKVKKNFKKSKYGEKFEKFLKANNMVKKI